MFYAEYRKCCREDKVVRKNYNIVLGSLKDMQTEKNVIIKNDRTNIVCETKYHSQ